MKNLEIYASKLKSLKQGDVFTDSIIESFKIGAIDKWQKKIKNQNNRGWDSKIRSIVKIHTKENMDALDEVVWNSISDLKFNIMKDTLTRESLFTRVREAIENKDYQTASDLQIELKRSMEEIQQLYMQYKKNIY